MKTFSIRYTLLTARLDQLWFPAAGWLLFVAIAVLFRGTDRMPFVVRAYLGWVIPLTAGVLAAYSVLDDPALELRFATPIPAWRILVERLGLVLGMQGLCAAAFQAVFAAMGGSLAILGGLAPAQLASLIPCLALMAVGCLASLAAAKPATGALAASLLWLIELIAHSSLLASRPGRYVFIFLGALVPNHPALRLNQILMLAMSIAFFATAWMLLRRQERYL